jgi:hypothetical protein
LPTSAERLPRAAVAVGVAAALVLVADVRAVSHLRGGARCGGGLAPRASSLDVSLRLTTTALRPGKDAAGEATVTNRSARTVVLRRADGVLLATGTRRVETWTGGSFTPLVLAPGTFARVPFVVHLARCPHGGAALVPGFHEAALLLEEQDPDGVRRTVSGSVTLVLPP